MQSHALLLARLPVEALAIVASLGVQLGEAAVGTPCDRGVARLPHLLELLSVRELLLQRRFGGHTDLEQGAVGDAAEAVAPDADVLVVDGPPVAVEGARQLPATSNSICVAKLTVEQYQPAPVLTAD